MLLQLSLISAFFYLEIQTGFIQTWRFSLIIVLVLFSFVYLWKVLITTHHSSRHFGKKIESVQGRVVQAMFINGFYTTLCLLNILSTILAYILTTLAKVTVHSESPIMLDVDISFSCINQTIWVRIVTWWLYDLKLCKVHHLTPNIFPVQSDSTHLRRINILNHTCNSFFPEGYTFSLVAHGLASPMWKFSFKVSNNTVCRAWYALSFILRWKWHASVSALLIPRWFWRSLLDPAATPGLHQGLHRIRPLSLFTKLPTL